MSSILIPKCTPTAEETITANVKAYIPKHLKDTFPDLVPYESPLVHKSDKALYCREDIGNFTTEGETHIGGVTLDTNNKQTSQLAKFVRVGPRKISYFAPGEVRAAIVTAGGLCPGINTVVRELVMGLWYLYDVRQIFGVQYGIKGFYTHPYKPLKPSDITHLHNLGGTWLGSSRGGFDLEKIVNALVKNGINQVYIIGGDGTHRAAAKIAKECHRRRLKICVVGIPKTVDNDIPLIDKSFGFSSAVESAQAAIRAGNVEANSAENGIGLIKVMGRSSGAIAMHATLSSRDVNVCLIPELPFDLEGEHGLLEYIRKRLEKKNHCVIVVAEGCGKYLIEDPKTAERDKSGNLVLPDAGMFLKKKIVDYCASKGVEATLKYIDPTYMVRSVPANAEDQHYCMVLAQHAVHGAMAGFTAFTVGPIGGRTVYLPFDAIAGTAEVDPTSRVWYRVLYSTGQPNFKPLPSKM